MREILFRGKRKDNKEWIEGTLFRISEKQKPSIMLVNRCGESYEVLPETVGENTGLTDKNGKKIFEDDICTNGEGNIGRVTWCTEHCAFMIYSVTENKFYWLYDNDFSKIEIIGNEWENENDC